MLISVYRIFSKRNPQPGGGEIPGEIPMSLYSQTSDIVGEFNEFISLKFNERLNGVGDCIITLPAGEQLVDLISLGEHIIEVYKDDVLVWAGSQSYYNVDAQNTNKKTITLQAHSWFQLLFDRFVASAEYVQIDQAEILWDLIRLAQAKPYGRLGFYRDTIETSILRDRGYSMQVVGNAITNMSEIIDGVDLRINPDKGVEIKPFIGVDQSATTILELGSSFISYSISRDFTTPVTSATVTGETNEDASLQSSTKTDLEASRRYGIRERLLQEIDVSEQDTLDNKALKAVQKYSTGLLSLSIEILPNTLDVKTIRAGDIISVKIQDELENIDRPFRIYEIEVEFKPSHVETVNILIGDYEL